jgi:sugar transferase EpsL
MRYAAVKRTVDVLGASFGLVVSAIPMAVVAVLVYLTMGTPVIYRQARPGLHGRTFVMRKFRTMRDATDDSGNLLPNRLRVTALGHFLRRTSLDELPELVNVLRGEMSLVGPRPLRVEYLDRYTPEQARRHDVLPGITGWAQINGRNALSWDERLALDIWYVDHASLWLDLKILVRTPVQLVGGAHASDDGLDVTEFVGTSDPQQSKPITRGKTMPPVEQEIRTFLTENFALGHVTQLAGDRSLTERGFIDSIGIVELLTFLETQYEIQIGEEETVPENIDTIDNIVRFVSMKRGSPEAATRATGA